MQKTSPKNIALKCVFKSDAALKKLINIIRSISYLDKWLHFCKVDVNCLAYVSKFTNANQAVKPSLSGKQYSKIVLLDNRNSNQHKAVIAKPAMTNDIKRAASSQWSSHMQTEKNYTRAHMTEISSLALITRIF